MSFDSQAFKSHFPLFQQQDNKDLVYLDNAATTQKPQTVIQALVDFYTQNNGNANRASHRLARRATEIIEQSRQRCAEFFQAESAKNIIFTSGATASLNFLASSLCQHLQAGDEIILSEAEHHANLLPWQVQAQAHYLKLRFLPMQASAEQLADLLNNNTKIISLCAVSNAVGSAYSLEQLLRPYYQKHDCSIIIDGSQLVAHEKLNLAALPCDYFIASAHKMYGPTSLGFLYGKTAALAQLKPWQYGGEMIQQASYKQHLLADIPYRFEAGTSPMAAIAGFKACLEFLQDYDMSAMRQYMQTLNQYLHKQLAQLSFIRLLSSADNNVSIASFVTTQDCSLHASDFATLLDNDNIAVRCGKLCAEPLLQGLAVDSVIRVSLAAYNNLDDIDALISSLKKHYQHSISSEKSSLAELLAAKNQQQRYRLLMQLAEQLSNKPAIRLAEHQVHGCESPLWLQVQAQDDHFVLSIDTDSRLLKGLAVILLEQLNHQSSEVIQAFELESLLQELALDRYINSSRQNGLHALVNNIKQQCR